MDIILMKCEGGRDCHNAAIGTACQVTYEEASKATGHRNLAGSLESPIFSNPWNMYRALVKLGFWKKNIVWHDILNGKYEPNKTIVLVKNSLLEQHWIVLGDRKIALSGAAKYDCYWGDSVKPVILDQDNLKKMFLSNWPNCAFQVYKANFWTLLWARIVSLF